MESSNTTFHLPGIFDQFLVVNGSDDQLMKKPWVDVVCNKSDGWLEKVRILPDISGETAETMGSSVVHGEVRAPVLGLTPDHH